ncbi:DUF4350 domain-containing protein, partial [uncultured Jatrophihabitans sp.]|uniref:DUF4350 domain-containing protein n=1 Tax=uncultured Jatrophihabitans sp. TaxID=1610747 RepID=UPI0035C993E8
MRAPAVAPLWRRTRSWLALAGIVVVGALVVTLLTGGSGRPLDPASASKSGSKALAVLLRQYGSTVRSGDDVAAARRADPGAVVLVTAPDDYSAAQLRQLRASAALLVLVAPGTAATRAVAPGVEPEQPEEDDPTGGADDQPGCADPGAQAAGGLALPDDATTYSGGTQTCYGGLLVTAPKVAILGSAQLLRNDHLGGEGVAALDVNLLSADRTIHTTRWLLPGGDAAGSGPASVWA